MSAIEAARKVRDEKQCHLLRPRLNEPGQFDAKPYGAGSKRGWFYLDLFTASAMVAVSEALNDENRKNFEALPILKMARVAMKLIN
jgi:hypothetical protein